MEQDLVIGVPKHIIYHLVVNLLDKVYIYLHLSLFTKP